MSLTLHFHPLSSFCQKVLVALYENDTPFTGQLVDLFDPAQEQAFRMLWSIRRFPVLVDDGRVVPESTTIIEHLDRHHRGATRLVPDGAEAAAEVRLMDRLFDLYINVPMQKVVTDRLRPEGRGDATGVEQARELLGAAYDVLAQRLKGRTWAAGEDFTMADCAAAPALRYAAMTRPFGAHHRTLGAYLERLEARLSFARVMAEGEPYMKNMPR